METQNQKQVQVSEASRLIDILGGHLDYSGSPANGGSGNSSNTVVRKEIKKAPSMHEEGSGDLSALQITAKERVVQEDGTVVYKLQLLGCELIKRRDDYEMSNITWKLYEDFAVEAVPYADKDVDAAKEAVRGAQKTISSILKSAAGSVEWLSNRRISGDEPVVNERTHLFEATETIYRKWEVARRTFNQDELRQLKQDCLYVFSKIRDCPYSGLFRYIRNMAEGQERSDIVRLVDQVARKIKPAAFMFTDDAKSTNGDKQLKEYVEAELEALQRLTGEHNPDVFGIAKIGRAEWMTVCRREDAMSKFSANPIRS